MVRTKSSRNQQRPIICESSASESDDDEKSLAETSKLKRLSKTSKLKDKKSGADASKLNNEVKSSVKQERTPVCNRSKGDDKKILSKSSKSVNNKNEHERSSLKVEESPSKSSKDVNKTPKDGDEKNVTKTSRRSSSAPKKKQDSDSDFEDSENFHSSSQKSRKSESLPQKKITKVTSKPAGNFKIVFLALIIAFGYFISHPHTVILYLHSRYPTLIKIPDGSELLQDLKLISLMSVLLAILFCFLL